jgi:hypothetical protein
MLRPCGRFFFGTISRLKPSACEGVKNDRTTGVLVLTGSAGVTADRTICGNEGNWGGAA